MFESTATRLAPPPSVSFLQGTLLMLCALSIVLPAPAVAQAPLTLAEAQRRAVARSTQLAAQDSAASAAREMGVAAAQLPDPVAKIGIDNLPVEGPDAFSLTRDFMTMRTIGVMQEFTRSEKRQARAARFEREADKFLAEKTAAVASIQRETALAWLERYYAQAMVRLVVELSREARAEIEAAEGAYRAGRGSLADVLATQSALVVLDDRASELQRRVDTAIVSLGRWAGEGADAALAAPPDIERLDAAAIEGALTRLPDLAALVRKEDLAAAEVHVARSARQPDWSAEVMFSVRGPAYGNMVSFNVSLPLPWDRANRQDREVAARIAVLDQARAEREDVVRARSADVRAMLIEWHNVRERRVRYERELSPLAAERTQALLGAYRGGKASVNDVLAARRNEIDVRLQSLELELAAARLWAQLNFLFPDAATLPPGTVITVKDTQ